MWAIYNKTKNKYWNSDEKEWGDKLEATSFSSYEKAEKEIRTTESDPNTILMIKPLLKYF